jgi:hypothetical protein
MKTRILIRRELNVVDDPAMIYETQLIDKIGALASGTHKPKQVSKKLVTHTSRIHLGFWHKLPS